MKLTYKDLANILNTQYANDTSNTTVDSEGNVVTNQNVVAPDLSNIYDFGKKLTDNPFSNANATQLIDKIVKTEFEKTTFAYNGLKIRKDYVEHMGVIENIRVSLGKFSPNESYDILNWVNRAENAPDDINSFERMFGTEEISVTAKYYNNMKSASVKYTLAENQFEMKFRSPQTMLEFASEIITKAREKFEFMLSMNDNYTVAYHLCGIAKSRPQNVIAVGNVSSVEEYANFFETVTSTIRELENFTDFAKAEGFVTSSKSHLKCAVLAEYMDKLNLAKADIYNPEYLKSIINFDTVNYFMTPTAKGSVACATELNDTGKYTRIDNIVAVLYDERALSTTYTRTRTVSVPVQNEEKTNYFMKADMMSYNNLDYPVIIFTKNGATDVTEPTV